MLEDFMVNYLSTWRNQVFLRKICQSIQDQKDQFEILHQEIQNS